VVGEPVQTGRRHLVGAIPVGQDAVIFDGEPIRSGVAGFVQQPAAGGQQAETPDRLRTQDGEPNDTVVPADGQQVRADVGRQVLQPTPDPQVGQEERPIRTAFQIAPHPVQRGCAVEREEIDGCFRCDLTLRHGWSARRAAFGLEMREQTSYSGKLAVVLRWIVAVGSPIRVED
jgi:hypothetical protein